MNQDDRQEIPWPQQHRQARWLVAGLAGLAFATTGALWLLGSVIMRGPTELQVPVHVPGPERTVVSGYTERETEYIDVPGPPLPPPPPAPPQRVLVPVERPQAPPPPPDVRVVPGPVRTVYVDRQVPGPTRTVTATETVTIHEHHHHEPSATESAGG